MLQPCILVNIPRYHYIMLLKKDRVLNNSLKITFSFHTIDSNFSTQSIFTCKKNIYYTHFVYLFFDFPFGGESTFNLN